MISNKTMDQIRLFFRLSRPLLVLVAGLLYILGTGIAHFLGATIDWNIYWIGLFWNILILLSTVYLNEYFDDGKATLGFKPAIFSNRSGAFLDLKLPRWVSLAAAGACLTVAASLTLTIQRSPHFSPATALILILIFAGSFVYAVPPVRLSATGFGEWVSILILAIGMPALGFSLQSGEVHRLVAMASFPLAALQTSMMLASELQDYADDTKYERKTLMVRLGWKLGIGLHNWLILAGFGVLGLSLLFGMPLGIGGPAMLALPVGAVQIWLMRQITDGAKPNWKLLTYTAGALFGVTAYILTFMFWTN